MKLTAAIVLQTFLPLLAMAAEPPAARDKPSPVELKEDGYRAANFVVG